MGWLGRRYVRNRTLLLIAGIFLAMDGVVVPHAIYAESDGWLVNWGTTKTAAERQVELNVLGFTEKTFYTLSNISWVKPVIDTAPAPDTRFTPNYIGRGLATTPIDPMFTNALTADDLPQRYINLPTAWDYNTGSPNVRIAVLDSGIDTTHADLDGNIETAVSFLTGNTNPGDKFGHGTPVAALIAAEANNGVGIAGVCWTCKIVSVRVLGDSNTGTLGDLVEALRWTAKQGVRIINMSLGFGTSDPGSVLQSAIQYVNDQGILMVAAAGNSGSSSMDYPARYDQVMAVGAIDPTTDQRAAFSSYKDGLELMAPGVSMFSDSFGGAANILIGDGTSFASPLVAGVAGLVWSEEPSLTRDEVFNRINSSAKDLGTPGWDEQTGFGCVDAAGALRVAAFRVSAGKDVISYPNPFRVRAGGNVTIRPPQDVGSLTVKLYSLDGRLLQTLTGKNEVSWDGRTSGGKSVGAGIYLFQASANNLKDEGRIAVIDW